MLVISRRLGESLMLTDGAETIEVRVVKIAGGAIKLGVIAPTTVRVMRKEKVKTEETPDM